eukprot:GEMP01090704.1.p1 GENE.GEMP01090704.1~~GEMP01090704.1.p1  ORF type:complete len:103 (-),score=2.73 GEMP01090704.1:360-668(-)
MKTKSRNTLFVGLFDGSGVCTKKGAHEKNVRTAIIGGVSGVVDLIPLPHFRKKKRPVSCIFCANLQKLATQKSIFIQHVSFQMKQKDMEEGYEDEALPHPPV